MKKLLCKLPPLQWGSLLAALIASTTQTLAMLLEFEAESNYFTRGATLPHLAILFSLLSLGLGIAAAFLAAKKKKLSVDFSTSLRKLHLFPAVGFFCALVGLGWELFTKAGVLWMHRNDGASFFKEFLAGETKIALLCLPLLFCALGYCWNWAFPTSKNQTETVILGFAAAIACAILGIHLYFDFSVEMNSPVKSLLQAAFLCSMIFFTTELRLLLKKPLPKLLWIISSLVIAVASLCAVAIPVAFLTGKLPQRRLDFFFYGLFALCMIPAALEHIFSLSAHDSNDPDQTERTETP